MLAHAEVEGQQLTDDEIVRFGMLMIFAGGETVEKTLATFVRNLVAHPAQLSALRADRGLMDRALAESLRYTAPTHMIPRKTRADLPVSGGTIPAEAEVICFLGSANRDERKFAAPDQYDMRRTDLDMDRAFTSAANHAAFGVGRHFCLGAMMAKTEVEIAVNRLLGRDRRARLRWRRAAGGSGLFLRGPSSLALRFTPAVSSPAPMH